MFKIIAFNTVQATAETEAVSLFSERRLEMLVKFSTLANGVFIEDNGTEERKPGDRCFRFDANGNAEYALFGDLTGSNPAPRWFGHQFRERDFTFA